MGRVNNASTNVSAEAAPFLKAVQPWLNGMNNTYLNMVRSVHSCADCVLT